METYLIGVLILWVGYLAFLCKAMGWRLFAVDWLVVPMMVSLVLLALVNIFISASTALWVLSGVFVGSLLWQFMVYPYAWVVRVKERVCDGYLYDTDPSRDALIDMLEDGVWFAKWLGVTKAWLEEQDELNRRARLERVLLAAEELLRQVFNMDSSRKVPSDCLNAMLRHLTFLEAVHASAEQYGQQERYDSVRAQLQEQLCRVSPLLAEARCRRFLKDMAQYAERIYPNLLGELELCRQHASLGEAASFQLGLARTAYEHVILQEVTSERGYVPVVE